MIDRVLVEQTEERKEKEQKGGGTLLVLPMQSLVKCLWEDEVWRGGEGGRERSAEGYRYKYPETRLFVSSLRRGRSRCCYLGGKHEWTSSFVATAGKGPRKL